MDGDGNLSAVHLVVVDSLKVDAVASAVDSDNFGGRRRVLGEDTPHDPDLIVLADGQGANLHGR